MEQGKLLQLSESSQRLGNGFCTRNSPLKSSMKHFPVFHIEDVFCLLVGGVDDTGDPALQHPVPCLSGPLFPCSGPIPEALGSLTNLSELKLDGNQLTGTQATFWCIRLLVLAYLDVWGMPSALLASRLLEPSGPTCYR